MNEQETMKPVPPGEILKEEFLVPMGIGHMMFAEHIGMSCWWIDGIVKGHSQINVRDAHLFSKALGTSVDYWLNLQRHYDKERTVMDMQFMKRLEDLKPIQNKS